MQFSWSYENLKQNIMHWILKSVLWLKVYFTFLLTKYLNLIENITKNLLLC